MRYQVNPSDSPAIIARTYGVPFDALIRANPGKPTTIVNGRTTWQGIAPGEWINVPIAGIVGDAAIDAANALAASNPCDPANVGLVCTFQRAIGFTGLYIDGKYGAQLALEVKKRVGHAPAGCSPRPSWWTPAGQSNCVAGGTPVPTPSAAPASAPAPVATAPSSTVASAAAAALSALRRDPGYCTSVRRTGTAVNTAVHNFKSAWNAANPSHPVPINTGNYESSVAVALSAALGGVAVPPGCDAAPTAQPAPVQAPPPAMTPGAPPPPLVSPAPAPTAARSTYSGAQIAAATAMNSALAAHGYKQADQGLYIAFQRAMGSTPDGFPGTGTMGRLSAVLAAAGVPMASVRVYPWRAGAYDGVNAPSQSEWGGAPAPAPVVAVPVVAPSPGVPGAVPPPPPTVYPSPSAPQAQAQPSTPGPAQPIVVAPEAPKKLSTGAIVAGAVGLAAIVGLVAVAASGKKKHGGGHSPRKASKHKPAHHKSGPAHHKPSKRKSTKHHKKK